MPNGKHQKISTRTAMVVGTPVHPASPANGVPDDPPDDAPDDPMAERIAQLPRDVGWMLFGVGFAGFVAPGIFGLPFMAAGGMILWPKTTKRLRGLLGGRSPNTSMTPGMKQIIRFLDDLERRYPSAKKPRATTA